MLFLLVGQLFSANASGAAAAERYFDPARGAGLRYNHPIVINSQGRTLWTHTMSRLRGNTDETRYNPEKAHLSIPGNTAKPNDHFEILITEFNADGRIKNGACLFFLQKMDDLKNTGLVKSGDTVRIISLYAAAGHKEKEGVIPDGRILHVENSSRLGEHDLSKELSHYDTFVSDASFPGTQDDGGKFILQGTLPGPLYAKDAITIQNKEYKRPLCAYLDGRWGNKFGELVAVKGADTKEAAAQFTMSLVDVDALSDTGKENLKEVLSAALKSKLFALSAEHTPGNTPFRFNPALHGGRSRALFNDPAWRFADANEGHIIFDVTPNGGSVKVVFSPGTKNSPEAYVIVIGDEKNSSTRLSKGDKVLLTVEGAKVSNAVFSDLGKSSSFWIKISGKVLTAGAGRELGKNEFLHFEETDAEAALVSFVGLASSESALFDNIVVNSKAYQAKLAAETKAAKENAESAATAAKAAASAKAAAEAKVAAEAKEKAAKSTADAATKKPAETNKSGTSEKSDKTTAQKTGKGAPKTKSTGTHSDAKSKDGKKKETPVNTPHKKGGTKATQKKDGSAVADNKKDKKTPAKSAATKQGVKKSAGDKTANDNKEPDKTKDKDKKASDKAKDHKHKTSKPTKAHAPRTTSTKFTSSLLDNHHASTTDD